MDNTGAQLKDSTVTS